MCVFQVIEKLFKQSCKILMLTDNYFIVQFSEKRIWYMNSVFSFGGNLLNEINYFEKLILIKINF